MYILVFSVENGENQTKKPSRILKMTKYGLWVSKTRELDACDLYIMNMFYSMSRFSEEMAVAACDFKNLGPLLEAAIFVNWATKRESSTPTRVPKLIICGLRGLISRNMQRNYFSLCWYVINEQFALIFSKKIFDSPLITVFAWNTYFFLYSVWVSLSN